MKYKKEIDVYFQTMNGEHFIEKHSIDSLDIKDFIKYKDKFYLVKNLNKIRIDLLEFKPSRDVNYKEFNDGN